MLFVALDGLGWVGYGPDVVGNGWDVMGLLPLLLQRARVTGGDVFYIFFQVLRLIGGRSI